MTSQAMIAPVSKAPTVPKLRTSREQFPAPRSSTGTSFLGPGRNGSALSVRAPTRANRPPSTEVSATSDRIGRYATSVGPANTSGRPSSAIVSPPQRADTAPRRGSRNISSSRVSRANVAPAASVSTRRLEYPHPADSGVICTSYPSPPEVRAGTKCVVTVIGSIPRSVHQRHRGVNRARDVVVVRVEQRPTHHQATHGGQRERRLPAPVGLVGVPARVAAEQQPRQRGRAPDALHLLDHRQRQPGGGRGRAETLGDVDRLDHGGRPEVVDDPAADPAGHER